MISRWSMLIIDANIGDESRIMISDIGERRFPTRNSSTRPTAIVFQ